VRNPLWAGTLVVVLVATPGSAGPSRLLVVVDQGSLLAEHCEAVSKAVGTIAAQWPDSGIDVMVTSGDRPVTPSPTEAAVRGSLCGSSAFLDAPGAPISAAEAFEILRKNEAVRDSVIHRTCGTRPAPGCGTGVAARAEALARGLSERSNEFLRLLHDTLASPGRPDALILISGGLPSAALSDSRLRRLRAIARETAVPTSIIAAHGASKGALRTTQERSLSTIAAALKSAVTSLDDPAAAAMIVSQFAASRPDAEAGASPAPAARPSVDGAVAGLVAMASAHVGEFARNAAVVLAAEDYEQRVKSRAGSFGLSGSTRMGIIRAQRTLRSEVALVQVLDGTLWLIARDVLAVDGRAVSERPTLGPSIRTDSVNEALRYLREVADSGARFNLGGIRRNLNTPTLALLVVTDAFRERFDFRLGGSSGDTRILHFEERAEPTWLQIDGSWARTTGRIWLDARTGVVRRTELVLASIQRPPSRATVTVDYERVAEVDAWMPVRMAEKYEEIGSRESDWIECGATYSNFRRFRVATRIR
jgi:hypothetical protein